MADIAEQDGGRRGMPWRLVGWGGAAVLPLVPLSAGFPWTLSDFVTMGALVALVGGGIELVVRASPSLVWRAGAGLAILAALLTVWVNLAVGMIGSEDNPYNLVFLGVIALALLGAIVARLRPSGMAWAMAAAAAAQLVAAAVGLGADLRGGILSALFALLWLLAAGLFRKAAQEGGRPPSRQP